MNNGQIGLGGFNILPKGVKNLLIINTLMFFATIVFLRARNIDLNTWLGLHYFTAPHFRVWQFITYMFMHANFMHLFFNMFALWMFGAAVENQWGTKKFLIYYLITGIGAALTHYVIMFATGGVGDSLLIGASGAVYGVLLAFGMLFPNNPIYIYFLIPIKAKWFVIIYGAIELWYGVTGTPDGVAHFAHLGGMIFGIILILLWRRNNRQNREQTYYQFNGSDSSDRQQWRWPFQKRENTATSKKSKYYVSRESGRPLSDEEFNARKQAEKELIDSILDKISKSGYDSLTAEEKKILFQHSQK